MQLMKNMGFVKKKSVRLPLSRCSVVQCGCRNSTTLDGIFMTILDTGPFYHGTKADLQVGDFLTAGFRSNYDDSVVMNHIYFTALSKGAGLAAEMAKGC